MHGWNGVGVRVEWREALYTWTPDRIENGVRVPSEQGESTQIRATIFVYR
jgi:hypothetical protein